MGRVRDGLRFGLPFVAAVLTAAGVVPGCSSDLPVASHLERARVLGARVQLAGDDTRRASVLPGESALVEWLVAGPTDPGAFPWMFATCIAIDGACVDAPGAPTAGAGVPVLAPFTTPDASALSEPRVPLMAGTLAGIDAARFVIPVQAPGDAPNHRPNLANDAVLLNGTPWGATDTAPAPGASCDATSGLLTITARASSGADPSDAEKLPIRLITDADDRESFVAPGAAALALEELQVSSLSTAGAFDSTYAEISATDLRPDADAVMTWGPPSFTAVPPGGLVVQFHIVVRDGRGGLDWIHRSLCALAR